MQSHARGAMRLSCPRVSVGAGRPTKRVSGMRWPRPVLTAAPPCLPLPQPSAPLPRSQRAGPDLKNPRRHRHTCGEDSHQVQTVSACAPRGPKWTCHLRGLLGGASVGGGGGPGRTSAALVAPPSAWVPAAAEGAPGRAGVSTEPLGAVSPHPGGPARVPS